MNKTANTTEGWVPQILDDESGSQSLVTGYMLPVLVCGALLVVLVACCSVLCRRFCHPKGSKKPSDLRTWERDEAVPQKGKDEIVHANSEKEVL